MNKIFLYSLLAVSLFASCDLTVAPTDRYDQETFWLGDKTARAGLTGCYAVLTEASLYGNASVLWEEAASPNAYNYDNRMGWNAIALGTHTTDLSIINGRWTAAYRGIGRCNALLDNIDRNTVLSSTEITQMKAEARFLRALYYQILVTYYKDVPLILSEPQLEQNDLPRAAHAEVVDFIIKELDEITPLLPIRNSNNSDYGRPTRGAALALKARLLLFEASPLLNVEGARHKWETAANAAQAVMDLGVYSLQGNYRSLFSVSAENGVENIFDIQFINEPNMGSSFDVTLRQFNNAAPIKNLIDSYWMIDGLPRSRSTYANSPAYENMDPRFKMTVVYPGSTFMGEIAREDGNNTVFKTPQTGFTFKKYSIYDEAPVSTAEAQIGENLSEINYMVLRYADVLLMYAEAKNELGELTEDVWNTTVREIRRRAGFSVASALEYPGGDSDLLREHIRYERRAEFAGEGYYYNDIRRWKIAETVMQGPIQKHDGTNIITRTFDAGRDYWWPVSSTQMELNPNLRPNNPGWGE
ncbi:RagB/SusD family nutrient uptake outer membrane protein [Sphingobacterium phlebotomi]|uniref:RagB/SusD family nutrient uptake outer membrane protein n=1 Tax=Sphingobacterium phlebotomi TaxID=2605433 RepID=A0A5D4H245_9SPHI|nr:RagB/SusD family nutrient uptake outer membrane protein [Sphingobacterium phlebotomi]TYR35101.1 RagB/SusD family nutrient uptake outer membrane protein [Sphingobacterium phlebotomi]